MGIKQHNLHTDKITTYWFKASEKEDIQKGFPWFFADTNGHFTYSIPHEGMLKIGFHDVGPSVIHTDYIDRGSADNYEN